METTLFKQEGDTIYFWHVKTQEVESEQDYWVSTKWGTPGKFKGGNFRCFDSKWQSDNYYNELLSEHVQSYDYKPTLQRVKLGIDIEDAKKRMPEDDFESYIFDFTQHLEEHLSEFGNGEFDDSYKEWGVIDNTYWAYLLVINKELALKNLKRYFVKLTPRESIFFAEEVIAE